MNSVYRNIHILRNAKKGVFEFDQLYVSKGEKKKLRDLIYGCSLICLNLQKQKVIESLEEAQKISSPKSF